MSGAAPRVPRAGVSLLEMLVALMVMSFVMVALASTVRMVGNLGDRMKVRGAEEAQALTRYDLQRAIWSIALRPPAPTIDAAHIFTGNTTGFEAVSPDSSDPQAVRLHRVAFDRTKAQITLTTQPVTAPSGLPRRLYPTVSSCTIRYWARRDGWQDLWRDRSDLPDLVKISCLDEEQNPLIPIVLQPALIEHQRLMSASSLVPPARPSRP